MTTLLFHTEEPCYSDNFLGSLQALDLVRMEDRRMMQPGEESSYKCDLARGLHKSQIRRSVCCQRLGVTFSCHKCSYHRSSACLSRLHHFGSDITSLHVPDIVFSFAWQIFRSCPIHRISMLPKQYHTENMSFSIQIWNFCEGYLDLMKRNRMVCRSADH